ncbi:MAG: AI-2E family transporter [Candidatus Baltobacteraceae bacterium]
MPHSHSIRVLVYCAIALAIGALVWMAAAVLDRIPSVLAVLIFTVLFAHLIYPLVQILSHRMGRGLAVVVIYMGVIAILLLAGAYLAPAVVAQGATFEREYPHIVANLEAEIGNPTTSPLLGRFPGPVRQEIAKNAGAIGNYVGVAAAFVGTKAVGIVGGTFTLVVDALLVFGLAFFFITDLEQIQETLIRLFPRKSRAAALSFAFECSGVIGGFVRGQVLMAIGVGVVASVILAAFGVRYAVLLGMFTGIASIVPIVGVLVGVVPALLVALVTVGWVKSLIVLALFVGVFELQGHIVTPIVISKSVGVTPLVVFVALLVGEEAFGILGMLLAIPVAGIIRVAIERVFPKDADTIALLERYRRGMGDPLQKNEVRSIESANETANS